MPPVPVNLFGDMLVHNVWVAAQAELASAVVGGLTDVTMKTAKTVHAFAQAVDKGVEGIGPEMLKAHRQVAMEAQDAIVKAYMDSKLGTPSYRTDPIHDANRRYAGDVLENLLREEGFVSYDEKGIYVGNTEILDAGARQWRRLNYGAGGAAGGGAQSFTVRWSNLDLFTLEEPGSARPPFRIPAGRWFGREFYPVSELEGGMLSDEEQSTGRADPRRQANRGGKRQEPRMTRGIVGKHWLAAGLESVARNIPAQYSAIFKKLYEEGDEAARRALAGDTGLRRPGAPRSKITTTAMEEI